jgi:hypothetical protein
MKRPACRAKRDGERLHRLGAAALAATLALTAGCRTTADMQRDYARTLRPADIEAPPAAPAATPAAAVRTFRVRLYADAGYQRQTLRWREKLLAQLERANRVLEPLFGVRLAAESVRAWESPEARGTSRRRSPRSRPSIRAARRLGVWVRPGERVRRRGGPAPRMAFQFGRHVVLGRCIRARSGTRWRRPSTTSRRPSATRSSASGCSTARQRSCCTNGRTRSARSTSARRVAHVAALRHARVAVLG